MTEGQDGPAPGPVPVVRFESVATGDEEQTEPAEVRVVSFDAPGEVAAASVMEFGGLADAPVEPVPPVAGLLDVGRARPELTRIVRLSELSAGRPPRAAHGPQQAERSAAGTAAEPRPRRARRPPRDATPSSAPSSGPSSAPGPGFGPGPEEVLDDPDARQELTGSGGTARKPRRGWGQPAELPPGTDPVAAAKEICLRLLADRAHTRQELGQALRRKGVPEEAAATVLERFDEVGLIDDAAFAGQWVRSRHNHKGLARRAIAIELQRKGIDDEVAGEALAEVDPESEEQRADELVRRKLRSLGIGTPEQKASATRRLVGMLARKGYSAGVSYRVVKQALAEQGVELDEFGAAEPGD